MAISLIQAATSDTGGTASQIQITFASAQTAGNMIVVAFGSGQNSTESVVNISDSIHNNYYLARDRDIAAGPILESWIYYAPNIAAAAAGLNVLTVNLNNAVSFPYMIAAEFSGLSTTSPLDVSNGANGNGTALSVSATTHCINDLIVGIVFPDGAGEVNGSSFALVADCPTTAVLMEYKVVSSAGLQTVDGSGNTGAWVTQIAAFVGEYVSYQRSIAKRRKGVNRIHTHSRLNTTNRVIVKR